MTAARKPAGLQADGVAAFLRANPGWLAENTELYRVLAPPHRVHGEVLADHMAAMLAAERAHAQDMSARADGVLAAGRAAAGLADRVQEAVVALMRAHDPAECVMAELPGLLGVDAACLCAEGSRAGSRKLAQGSVGRLLGRRDVVFREAPADAQALHGEAASLARVDALVRTGPRSLLALASRDRSRLHPGQGSRALSFLGRSVAAALER
jgi:uncharacterized protein YigA (DUF484 family)